jgi:sulfite reductase alpha subunit-like flavoprotein
MVRVKVSRGNEEPSTQRRTKARHDPAALRAVQEALGKEGSQRSSRPRRGDPPPSYAEESEEEIIEEEEERTESDGDEEDETYEQSPEPPRHHGKGPAKEKPRYKPHPKKSHQAPYVHQIHAATRVPPKHKQGVAAHICPKNPPRLIPTLPPNVRVVETPIKLRDPGSILGLAEHMIRDYSKNALAVREQREDNVYLYLKGEGIEARFWCEFHRDFYLLT